jgi:hypothetical protein
MIAPAWQSVRQELDRWSLQGLKARFWVRDDDACEMSGQLDRLRGLADRHDINIGLAIIPAKVHHNLVNAFPHLGKRFQPMCHGWQHANYGQAGQPEEFGDCRPLRALREDAEKAYKVFTGHFGIDCPIFVPPFSRIASDLVTDLPRIGFAGLSAGPGLMERRLLRLSAHLPWMPVLRLRTETPVPRFDVQIDLIDWSRSTARQPETVAADLVANLRLRRRGFLPCDRPIGLLTHHLVHDEPIWRLCDDILEMLKRHEAVGFLSAAHLIVPSVQNAWPQGRSLDIRSM